MPVDTADEKKERFLLRCLIRGCGRRWNSDFRLSKCPQCGSRSYQIYSQPALFGRENQTSGHNERIDRGR